MNATMTLRAYERQKRYGTSLMSDWNSAIHNLCVGYQSSMADFEGISTVKYFHLHIFSAQISRIPLVF